MSLVAIGLLLSWVFDKSLVSLVATALSLSIVATRLLSWLIDGSLVSLLGTGPSMSMVTTALMLS